MAMRYDVQQRLPSTVSEAEQERVVEELQRQFVADALDAEQLSQRVRAAYAARTREELAEAAGVPLPPPRPSIPAAPRPSDSVPATASAWLPPSMPSRRGGAASWVVSVMGSVTRKGGWRVAEQTVALAIMGSCELDLRQAVLTSAEPQIVALSCMGNVNIVVPEGMPVEVAGCPLLGSLECKTNDVPPAPNAPVLRLRVVGLACLGSVTVKSRPGGAPVLAAGHAW